MRAFFESLWEHITQSYMSPLIITVIMIFALVIGLLMWAVGQVS